MIIILLLLIVLLPTLLLLVPANIFRSLRSWRQTLNWEACLILASLVAFVGYVRIDGFYGPPIPLPAFLFWALKLLAIISPTCLVVAWLRWSGVSWKVALSLFPIVPIGAITIWLMRELPRMMG